MMDLETQGVASYKHLPSEHHDEMRSAHLTGIDTIYP
jgi:hypothetical protein